MGFIKYHRKIDDWEWRADPNTHSLFCWLLSRANWKDGNYMGHEIKRGQCVFGRFIASERLGMSEMQIRTALEHLKTTKEITIKTTNRFSIITICNYNTYQDENCEDNQQDNQQITNKQPADNHIQEDKNDKKEKNKSFVPPALDEVKTYCLERKNGIDPEEFIAHYEARGWKYNGGLAMKNWKAAIITWEKNRKQNTPPPIRTGVRPLTSAP